tara:strand:+ start:14557 stop:16560 length:2004 start_codon:yes stop_codon:yes gene_type:complete
MKKEEVRQRIKKLKKVIFHHRYLYHVLDRQEISDAALDSLKQELYKLEEQYPEFITPDSPSQRVGGKPLEQFQKVKQKTPMLSIDDLFSEKELKDWQNYLKRLEPDLSFEYFLEYKMDGFAVSLVYSNGILKVGATRGDGKIGEDVTQNLKTIESIPLRLNPKNSLVKEKIKGMIEVRGEVYMDKKDFDKFNQERVKKNLAPYANPRNLAAGSIRQLDSKLASSRPLKFSAYDIITDLGQRKHSQEHQILPDLGFKTDPGEICHSLKEIVDFWRKSAKKRKSLPFQIDGVVISVNHNLTFKKLGVAGKSPRGIRAFKFIPKQATTKVLDIKVQIGRTGVITPIAQLEPVKVGGVTISRATLHNEDEIKRLGVKIGDTIIIERAGDVIPAVFKVLKDLRTGKEKEFKMPKKCSVCDTTLLRPKGEVAWRCPNLNCQAQRKESLYHFVSKKAFDIKGLGPKIIDKLMDENLISQASDLFELEEGDLIPLERFAEKSAKNSVSAIRESRKISLSRFIYALGIRHVGEETAIDLAQYFSSLKNLNKASKETLEALPDIGPEVSKSIYKWFQEKRNQELIDALLKAGVEILPSKRFSRKLIKKTFVITGTLKSLTRSEAQKKIRLLGGSPLTSLSLKTNYLVVGENPGSKLQKAKKLGVKIIDEKEFLRIIK